MDVGCGAGGLLAALADRGWRVHGLDLAPRAVEAAVAWWRTTRRADEVLDVLIRHAEATDLGIRAIRCLGEMGPVAARALPVLREGIASERRLGQTHTLDAAFVVACREAVARIET